MKKYPPSPLLAWSLSIVSMLLVSSAFAATETYKDQNYKGAPHERSEPGLLGGYYVGAALGYDSYAVKENMQIRLPTSSGSDLANSASIYASKPIVRANSYAGGLFAGYGHYFDELYYLGGEVFGNWVNAHNHWVGTITTLSTDSIPLSTLQDIEFTAKNNFGLSLLPGIKLSKTALFYARLGYSWSKVEGVASIELSGLDFTSGTVPISERDSVKGIVHGVSYGLGMEDLIVYNLSLRGEFTHTNYNEFDTHGPQVDFTPIDNKYTLALIYHFD